MSHPTPHSKPADKDSKENVSTDSQSKETTSNEIGWLVSGLLILVLGIGGILMFSQEEELHVGSAKPVASDQLLEAFPSPAIASEPGPTPRSSDLLVLPVSTAPGGISPDGETNQKKIIEEMVVYFEFDQAVLSNEAKTRLGPQDQTHMDKNKTILVRGHTDRMGSEAYNQNLSIRRAKAVKEYLVSLGHTADSIHVEGFGKTQPACNDATDACAAKNRRVNLYFSKPPAPVPHPEPLVSQTISESNQDHDASLETPTEGTKSGPATTIETVQLTESEEEILPPDPIASIMMPQ